MRSPIPRSAAPADNIPSRHSVQMSLAGVLSDPDRGVHLSAPQRNTMSEKTPGHPTTPPTFLERLIWLIAACAFWTVVYVGCNWITSRRSEVRVIQFAWERHIPLIGWMIIPYCSLNLFF